MFELVRPVRFEEVDAAGILFFPRYLTMCHDAMAALFEPLPGGYPALITKRRVGLPSVRVESDFKAPLRYGDAARICALVTRLGDTSVTFEYELFRASDRVRVAAVKQITVVCNLDTMEKLAIPADMRAVLESHLT